jgi:hypothetical protein
MDKNEQLDQIKNLVEGFTQNGTPLQALFGDKMELGVILLTCAMISNENLAASMEIEEQVDSAIHFYNIIQDRIGYYRSNQAHSLEKLL